MRTYVTHIKSILLSVSIVCIGLGQTAKAQTFPTPNKIVILILENHAAEQIIGSSAAPHINALSLDSNAAWFTSAHGIEHPSQPNYLDLFSGCNQGVTDDNVPTNIPFTTDNLGRQLLDSGKTFLTFSEDLPSIGYNGKSSGNYARKHNPAANWMGTGTNQIPTTTNQPLSAFSSDYSLLPTVSLVIPNQNNDMHNGTNPTTITTGDAWFYSKMSAYMDWTKTHNSLFILTFDEDNDSNNNHIVTIFYGPMVKHGQYTESINHYNVLRTLEDMFGLRKACNAATATPITNCWKTSNVGLNELKENNEDFTIYPNPNNGKFILQFSNATKNEISIFNVVGEKIGSINMHQTIQEIDLSHLEKGMYYLMGENGFGKKIVIN